MELLQKIEAIVREAGQIVLSAREISSCTHLKSSAADLVTAYDVQVETFLKERLLALLPEAIFFGEEETEQQDPSHGWAFIVDPIDGTANFVRGFHQSAISVALARDARVEYAVIFNPYKNELFSAKRGCGAFCNAAPIHVSTLPLERGIFGMGTAPYNRALHQKTMALASQLFERSCDFRRMGAAALDLCAIACGQLEVFFEYQLSPWDYAAGSLLITEAGGCISTLEGKPLPITEKCSVWACGPVNADILNTLTI